MLREKEGKKLSYSHYASYDSFNKNEEVLLWNKRKVALWGLILSLIVIIIKIFTIYGDNLRNIFLEQKLISYKVFAEDGTEMLMYSWQTVAKYSHIWLPVLCGIYTTYFTWNMVYIDSNVPGIQPPSPFSPKKYKEQSGHDFHLNYMFAIVIGCFVAFYMYLKGFSIAF